MIDPRDLAQEALALVKLDLEHIRTLGMGGKLEHSTASDLARYLATLMTMAKDSDEQKKEQRKKLGKLSLEELDQLYHETRGSLKGAKP
jgi:hypothetical protein